MRETAGWDVRRMARELISHATEPVAALPGLMHRINSWERDATGISERYWRLYCKVFPDLTSYDHLPAPARAPWDPAGATARAREFTARTAVLTAAAARIPAGAHAEEIRTLTEDLHAVQQQVTMITARLEELTGKLSGDTRPGTRRYP